MSSSQHNSSGNALVLFNSSRSRSRSRSISRGRLSSSSGGGGVGIGGQSSLSAHIQLQMERPRRERDPTPMSSAHAESMPNLNYFHGPAPLAVPSPPRRASATTLARRTSNNNNNINLTNGGSSPSSCEERAVIAANLAKSSFSAHRNLQKLIDEQREREYSMEDQCSSVAAVNQQPPQHSPLKLLVGHEGFQRQGSHCSPISTLSSSTSTLLTITPSTVATMTPASEVGQQYQQQYSQQRRSSSSLRMQYRDQSMNTTRLPSLDEKQQLRRSSTNTIVTDPPDSELAQSIAKIVSFQKRTSTPCSSSLNVQQFNRSFSHGQNVSCDTNTVQQQQQHQRRNKTESMLDRSDSENSWKKSRSFHGSTAPATSSSLNSGSLFDSPSNSSSSKSPKSQPQSQHPTKSRYIDKETLHNHLMHAPRESRVQLTRLIENLQNENQKLNVVNLAQVNQIDKLEAEVADLLRELLRYRRECGELESVAVGAGGNEEDVSSENATAPPTSMPPTRQMHSPSKVEMDRQDATAERKLDVLDRRRPATTKRIPSSMVMRNSMTSAPDVVKRPLIGGSNVSFSHNSSMLEHLQLTQSSPSDGDETGSSSTASFHSCSPADICCSDSLKTGDASMFTADESLFYPSVCAKNKSFKEVKKADTHASSRWRVGRFSEIKDGDGVSQSGGEGIINDGQIMLIQRQQEHKYNNQVEASRQTMVRSNSLEDLFAPPKRRSCFVEQKDGSTAGSVPSMTESADSWSCSTPGSEGN